MITRKRLRKQLKRGERQRAKETILRVGWHRAQAAGSEHTGQIEKQAITAGMAPV